MMTTLKHTHESRTETASELVTASSPADTAAHYALGALRIIIGWTFLWAFLDKLLALGFSTGRDAETGVVDRFGDAAWIHGGNPTLGFLSFGADGPFAGFYHSIAGDAWTNWAFMFGLLSIGVALTFGVFTRLGTIAGVAMFLMMYTVALLPDTNPIVDDHILGAAAVLVVGLLGASRYLGLGQWWAKLDIVQQYPILK
jgi:thiosulfate dehydrogenase [quinone] large subunit